jgi:hypothetical protein
MAQENVVGNAVRLVGEWFLPGASRLIDGEIKEGVLYAAAGLAARVLVGPIGLLLVKADSFSLSATGKHLPAAVGLGRETEEEREHETETRPKRPARHTEA